jgi:hypothetical protein
MYRALLHSCSKPNKRQRNKEIQRLCHLAVAARFQLHSKKPRIHYMPVF